MAVSGDTTGSYRERLSNLIEVHLTDFEAFVDRLETSLGIDQNQSVADAQDIARDIKEWFEDEESYYKQYKNLEQQKKINLKLAEKKKILDEELAKFDVRLKELASRLVRISDAIRKEAGKNFTNLPKPAQRRIDMWGKTTPEELRRNYERWLKQGK